LMMSFFGKDLNSLESMESPWLIGLRYMSI
jgi:hypothetical protein